MAVAACLIVRNECSTLERCVASVAGHVDEICVYDTGSDDGTPELAAALGCRVEQGVWRDSFALARASSFAMTEAAWVLWLDADEEIVGGSHLRGLVADADSDDLDALHLHHRSRHFNPQGTATVTMWRDAVVRRGSATWEGRVHEVLRPARPVASRRVPEQLMRISDTGGDRRLRRPPDHYLRLVELDVAEGRTMGLWYRAWIHAARGEHAQAAVTLEEFIERPDAPGPLRAKAIAALPEARRLALARFGIQAEVGAERATAGGERATAELAAARVSRNDPCPCGSGLKFKRCHGA